MFGKLTSAQRQRLTYILVTFGRINSVSERLNLLDVSGLSIVRLRLPLQESTEIFAASLIRELERLGSPPSLGEFATLLLINYLREETVGHPEITSFLDELAKIYTVTSIASIKSTLPSLPPHSPSRFTGRKEEVAIGIEIIRSKQILTICGVGGVGKTRTSLEIADRLKNIYPDFATYLSCHDSDLDNFITAMSDWIDDKGIIIIDDAESLDTDGIDKLKKLTDQNYQSATIIVSRHSINFPNTKSVHLHDLSFQDFKALFLSEAQHYSHANITNDILFSLYQLLGGIPLAIQLAIGFLSRYSATQLLHVLTETSEGSRFELLLRQRSEDTMPISEVKVLVLGEANVGKSSLIQRLMHDIPPDQERNATLGILIEDWNIKVKERNITLHFWDFGGQEIMHTTHQMFLTTRSLYLLVLDSTANEQLNRLEDWLNLIYSYAPDAPIIIAINKSETYTLTLNQRGLRERFNVVAFIYTSCIKRKGIDELKDIIEHSVKDMPHLNETMPVSWMAVRERLKHEFMKPNTDYLLYHEFRDICKELGTESSATAISDIFHQFGVLLHYRGRRDTKTTHIFDPNWITKGIYPLLNDQEIISKGGFLTEDDIERVLTSKNYSIEHHNFIIGMMVSFELILPLEADLLLIPSMLSKEAPTFTWDYNNALHFIYQYEYLPPSLFPRFIFQMRNEISPAKIWRYGVILEQRSVPYALLVVKPEEKQIEISINLPPNDRRDARTLLDVIRDKFDALHIQFTGLTDRVKEVVPLPNTNRISTVAYKHLLRLEERGKDVYVGEDEDYPLQDLLNGFASPESRRNRDKRRAEPLHISLPIEEQKMPTSFDNVNAPREMLAFFANAMDVEHLPELNREMQTIRELLVSDNRFIYRPVASTRLRDLRLELDKPPHIFHFSGHAVDEGILLENQEGTRSIPVAWITLARELKFYAHKIECILLNGCKSLQEDFINVFVPTRPYIIAMSSPIGDGKATMFAERFYQSLRAGDPITLAYEKGCNVLRDVGEDIAQIPILIPRYPE